MFKKLTALSLSALLVLAVGCAKTNNESSEPSDTSVPVIVESEPEPIVLPLNPLTGLHNMENGAENRRPVAIMVNNVSTAQPVQTGVGKADIVYETEVEGGITRLLAVYQDVTKVERIGTIRSARYAYIDLAKGHNAVYIHHGQDGTYAGPHLRDINHINIGTNNGAQRISNGLAYEHTLYTFGDRVWNTVSSSFNTDNTGAAPWQNFAAEDESITLTGGIANAVNVPFSGAQRTRFVYDAATGKYIRYSNGNLRTDYLSGETLQFKNILVLLTGISYYSDNYHRRIALDYGSGYYVTNGTYTPINWSKGSADSSFKFTNADGSALTMSAGNTWVCIASNTKTQPSFE